MSGQVRLAEEDVEAVLATLRGGWLTMGPRTAQLEEELAGSLGVAHAVAVSSGTAALHLACVAAGLEEGASAVVAAPASPGAHAAPRVAGGRVLRADVEDLTAPRLTAATALAVAEADTRVVVASHLAGVLSDAGALRGVCDARGWVLVEDARAALGARHPDGRWAGAVGHAGCLSLRAGRLVGVGEGGAVVTDDAALAARVRSLRSHAMTSVTWDRHRGHADTYDVVGLGFNLRLDEPRAALASSLLARLDELVAARRRSAEDVAARLRALDGVIAATTGPAPLHVAVLARSGEAREAVSRACAAAGLETARWPADAGRTLPVAGELHARSLLVDVP